MRASTASARAAGATGFARDAELALAVAVAHEAGLALDVAAAKSAAQALTEALEGPERELRLANALAEKAALAVLALAAEPLVCDIFSLRERMVERLAALMVVEPIMDAFEGGQILADVQAALARARHDDLAHFARRHPAGDLWRASAAALALDADARLPPD
jgi:hypothetical protein